MSIKKLIDAGKYPPVDMPQTSRKQYFFVPLRGGKRATIYETTSTDFDGAYVIRGDIPDYGPGHWTAHGRHLSVAAFDIMPPGYNAEDHRALLEPFVKLDAPREELDVIDGMSPVKLRALFVKLAEDIYQTTLNSGLSESVNALYKKLLPYIDFGRATSSTPLASMKPEWPRKAAPIPMLLHCPVCRERHVDAGEFAEKPHHTHACQSCGHVWRPALVDTVGVRFLPGFKDAP